MDDITRVLSLNDIPLAVVDVETTGASFAYGDRVVEIGIVRIEAGQVVHEVQQLLNPGRPMTGGASRVTGITDLMLFDQPSFAEVWPACRSVLTGCVIVGHNVTFDLSFLDGECRRFGSSLRNDLGEADVLDTCRLARKLLGRGGNGLQRLADRFDLPRTTAHRALADCQTTAMLLHKLLEPLGGWATPLNDALARQGGSVKLPDPAVRPASPLADDIADLLIAGRMVQITYVDAKRQQTERRVTPRYVRRQAGRLTLVAHCHTRNADRMFTLTQIVRVEHCE